MKFFWIGFFLLTHLHADNLVKFLSANESYKGELILEKKADKVINTFMLTLNSPKPKIDTLTLHALDIKTQKETTIILYDNGKFGDEMAGDGIYSGTSYLPFDKKQRFFFRDSFDGKSHTVLFETVLLRF
jgi:hypothetical protein